MLSYEGALDSPGHSFEGDNLIAKRDVPVTDMARAVLRVCQSTSPPTLQTLATQ